MIRTLRHHLWLPLLFLSIGHNRHRRKACRSSNGSCMKNRRLIFGPVFVDADDAAVCMENQCNPNCKCVLDDPDNVTCAEDFGKWGWIPHIDSGPEVWREIDQEYELKYGTIQPTGMRGANRVTGIGRGIGRIVQITNLTLDGQVYFEMHPDQLDLNLGSNQESLIVELYGGMDFGLRDCDQVGIMLGHQLINMTGYNDVVSNFDFKVERFDDYNSVMKNQSIECHPRSANGRLATLNFSLKNPFYYNERSPSVMNIWYPFRSNVDFGALEFCVRLELVDPDYESEDDDLVDDYYKKRNVTSYMDTKFKVEVSAPTAVNGYTRFQEGMSEVKVYSNKPFGPVEGLTTYQPLRYNITSKPTQSPTSSPTTPTEIIVPVTTYHCSAPDESDVPGAYDAHRTFQLGQTFRLCVGPTKSYEKDYRVIGFQSIVCENSIRNTTIIDQNGIPNDYTRIDRKTIGFTKRKGGIITSNRTLSISSVIDGNLAGDFPEGNSYFVCRGIVYLESTAEESSSATGSVNAPAAPIDGENDDIDLDTQSTLNPTAFGTGTATQGDETGLRGRKLVIGKIDYNHELGASASRHLQVETPKTGDWQNENLQSWDKISSNPNLPIVGTLSIRIDITPDSSDGKVSTFVNKSVNKVKEWFTSSASREHHIRSKSFVSGLLVSTVLLPLLIFA